MTVPKPTLDEVYQRWRTAHPTLTGYVSTVPDGYRRCRWRSPGQCMVLIADDQERGFCYGHGGKPNVLSRRPFTPEDFREYQKNLRKRPRLHRQGRPYTA